MNSHPHLGRNDPCWCGSGKKYKHCHQRADEERASESLQKNALWHALGEFALQRKYDLDFKTAAQFFFDADEPPDPEGGAEEQADFERALDYFLFDYRLSDNTRVIEHFALERGRILSPRQHAWLTGWLNGAPALLEIVAVQRGEGVRARDLLTNEIYDIHDKLGSETTNRWSIAYMRVLRTDDHYEFGGSGLTVPPRFRGMLLAHVQELRGDYASRYPDATTNDFLHAHAHLLNQYIRDDVAAAMSQMPILVTPEGDLMEQAIATFDVLDHAHALARLRAASEFEMMENETPHAQIFAWHETGESSAQLRAHGTPYEQKATAGDPTGVRALGTVVLNLDELKLDVMSRRRLHAGKTLLEKYLGDAIRFRDEQIESFAEALAARDDDDDEFEDEDEFDDDDESEEELAFEDEEELDEDVPAFDPNLALLGTPPAELQEHLARYRANYNQTWIDLKIAALDNQTPRQAVETFGGRLQVIRLLKDFEAREAETATRGTPPFDWSAVAHELGLSEQEFLDETRVEDLAHEMLALLMDLTLQHQTDQAWEAWRKFRELFPIRRAEDLWFAQVWDLDETLTETVMELEYLLARQKRFDEAHALVEDYIALDTDAVDWALAERAAIKIERAIFSDPVQVQAGVMELETLAQSEDSAFQALIILAELQQDLLRAPDAAVVTLLRADDVATDDKEQQRVYDTLLEHFDSFRECEAGKAYWHQCNDELALAERDVPGLVRLLLSCGALDDAAAAIEQIENEETRDYFFGKLAAQRGNLKEARKLWQSRLTSAPELFEAFWFEWAELCLYLHDSAVVLEKLDTAARGNHYLAHWFRALAYAQQNDFVNASGAAEQARAAMRAQARRMDYGSTLRQQRARVHELGLSDAAVRALNLEAPVE